MPFYSMMSCGMHGAGAFSGSDVLRAMSALVGMPISVNICSCSVRMFHDGSSACRSLSLPGHLEPGLGHIAQRIFKKIVVVTFEPDLRAVCKERTVQQKLAGMRQTVLFVVGLFVPWVAEIDVRCAPRGPLCPTVWEYVRCREPGSSRCRWEAPVRRRCVRCCVWQE